MPRDASSRIDSTMSAFATPLRRHRREVEMFSVHPRRRPKASFCAGSMNDLTWPATPSSSHAIFHRVGSRYGNERKRW
jgi:hypothetical protein